MEAKNIQILKCKYGVTALSMDYFNSLDSHNYGVTDTEFPHPDLINAFKDLRVDLARSLFSTQKGIENYKPNGFLLDERDDVVTVVIKGKVDNPEGYTTNVSSGKLPLEGKVEERIETLRLELYRYFFENKTAQLEIPYKDKQGNNQG